MGLYPNTDVARKRLNKMKRRGLIRAIAYVDLHGKREQLWFCGFLRQPHHEAEITEIEIGINAPVRRYLSVQTENHCDAEILLDEAIPWEHESCGKSNRRQIQQKMRRLGDRKVLWTCRNHAVIDRISAMAPSSHLFTTTALAMEKFHEDIWVNCDGDIHPPW
jgi:hypothetical protein